MKQKKWVLFWLALTAALIVLGQSMAKADEWKVVDDDWCHGSSHKCQVREITLSGWEDVAVHTVNGNIEVETWDRDEIRVLAKITVSGSDKRETMERIEIRTSNDHEIYAKGPRSDGGFLGLFGGRRWSVSYRLMVPRETDVEVETTNGEIAIDGVQGDVGFGSVNGGVRLTDLGGDVRGGTTNGSVRVTLSTHGWNGSKVDLHTTNGGIKIDVPHDFSAQVDVSTTNGGIDIDSPMRIEHRSRNSLRGRIGDGDGVILRARTTNGGVHIYEADA